MARILGTLGLGAAAFADLVVLAQELFRLKIHGWAVLAALEARHGRAKS